MATTNSQSSISSRAVRCLRQVDPGGAYWRYAVYVTALVALAALGGYASCSIFAASDANYLGSVYAGILVCLTMLFLKPSADRYPLKDIAAAAGALLIGAGAGGFVGHLPALSQGLAVVIAFAGFYMRRWPEPLPMAGLVMVLSYIISQIMAPSAPDGVIHAAILPLIVCVAIGFSFLPRVMFTRALLAAVARMRSAVPGELTEPLHGTTAVAASVKRVDELMKQVNGARAQADLYNPGNTDQHLRLVNMASTIARVWENAADSLNHIAGAYRATHPEVLKTCRKAEVAVAAAVADPTPANRTGADEAIGRIDALTDSIIDFRGDAGGWSADTGPGDTGPGDTGPGDTEPGDTGSGAVSFHLINARLTLKHLLAAFAALDAELADQSGAGR